MTKKKTFIDFIPDSFTISILLTLFVFVISYIFKTHSFTRTLTIFGDSLWNLNTFTMQMILILVLGNTLAKTKVVLFIIDKITNNVIGIKSALIITLFVSAFACLLNWGFGLVVGSLISISIARKQPKLNFPLIVATAYSGFMVWHGGLSGSVPLDLNSMSGVYNRLTYSTISTSETIFTWFNFSLIISTLLAITLVVLYFSKEENVEVSYKEKDEEVQTFTKFEESKLIPKIISGIGICFLYIYFMNASTSLTLNIICTLFLFITILLHNTLGDFLNAFNGSVKNAAGIIIQFPFYAAIMGMMTTTGIARDISEFFVKISTKDTIMIYTYLSSGLINLFVPSGGGQWAIQAPIVIPAAKQMGIPLTKLAMSVAWGDAWTNIIQPFWAIPILSLAGLSVREIFKYCFALFIGVGVACSLTFYLMV